MIKKLAALLDKKCLSLWFGMELVAIVICLSIVCLTMVRIEKADQRRMERHDRERSRMALLEYKMGFLKIRDKSLMEKRAATVGKMARALGFTEGEVNGHPKRQSWNIYE
jgi:hypothetical protein